MNTSEKVSCPNCSQPYSITSISPQLQGRLPLLLSCGHSVCEACITNITKFAEPFECKFCLQETQLDPNELKTLSQNPRGIREYFPINAYLLGDIVLQIKERNSEHAPEDFYVDLKYILNITDNNVGICVECRSPTSTMCKQCGTILCNSCFEKIHKAFLSFKDHNKQNITPTNEPNYCGIHKEKIAEYYCTECSKCICVNCMIVGGEKSCKNHNILSVQEKNSEFLNEIMVIGPKVDETYRRLTHTALNVGRLLENLNSDKSEEGFSKLINNIKTNFAKLHAQLQKNECEILNKIKIIKQSENNSLLGIKSNIEENIKKSKEILNKINTLKEDENSNKTKKNLSKDEIALLFDLIQSNPVLTSKETNATTNKIKEDTWTTVTSLFNGRSGSFPRTKEQLKLKWDNLKKAARKRTQQIRMNNLKVNISGLLESAKQVVDMPWYIQKEGVSLPKLTINEDIYEQLTNFITLENNKEDEYKLLATKDIEKDTEIPPPPSAPVFPPEVTRDVREIFKPKSADSKKLKISMEPPKYRSKSGFSSSLNSCLAFYPVNNKNSELQLSKSYDKFQMRTTSTNENNPRHFSEGCQDLVFISHLEFPNNFFVQQATQQHLVREMINEFRKCNKFPQPSLKQIQEGKIFLIYDNKEKTWNRCRVMQIEAKDNMEPIIKVFCIDFGNTEFVKKGELRLIPSARAKNPPPLAVRCSLANCQPVRGFWTTEDTILMQKIIDNKQAVIYIRRILTTQKHDITLECDLITFENAVNLAFAFVFQGRARLVDPKLDYPVLRNLEEKPKIFYSNTDFQPNAVEEVLITHIVSPDKFYIRKCYLQDTYDKLCEDLDNTYCLQDTARSVYCPTEGMVCVVNLDKYTEQVSVGGWQRAIVRELVGHGRVQLTLVDTGEIAVVHWSTLRYIKPEFTKFRSLAVECHLNGITPLNKRWSTGSLTLLQSFQSKVLKVEIADSSHMHGSLGVNLYYETDEDIICINTEMIQQKYAISIGTYMFSKPVLKEKPIYPQSVPIDTEARSKPKKKKISIMTRKESLADQLNDSLEAKDKGPIKLEVKILSYISPSLFYVSLVDQQSQFREMFESIQTYYAENKTQPKAKWNVGDRCCTICIESGTWRRAAILEIINDNAKVFYIDFAIIETVPLEQLRELPEEFLKMGGAVVTCHLSGIMPALGDEWPSITKEHLKDLIDAYQRFFITKNGTIKDKSLPVELWVYHITQGGPLEPNHAEWRCLNKNIVEQGLAIPERSDTNSEPSTEKDGNSGDMLSFLNVTGSISEWLQIETFTDETSFDVSAAISSNSSESGPNSSNKTIQYFPSSSNTDLKTDEQKSLDTKNRTTAQSHILDWLPPEDLTKNEFTGVPTYIDNDAVIYLYDICQQEDLDIMRDTLDECFKNSVAKTADTYWSVGQPCIARFYLDEKFYRGRVIAVNDENKTCFVHYVDYGNEEMCSVNDMRKRLVLWKLPIQSHKCILSRVQPISGQWDRQTLDFIHKMIVEKNCFIKVIGEKVGELTPIDLKVGQLWLSEHLVDLEKAKFTDGTKVMVPQFGAVHNIDKGDCNSSQSTDSSPEYIVEDEDVSDQLNDSKTSVLLANVEGRYGNKEEDQIEPEEIMFVYSNMQIVDTEFVCTISTIYDDQFELIIKNNENAKNLDKIHKEIEEIVDELPNLNGFYEKRACIALFEGDNKWYRASILQYSEKKGLVKVKFVDFGDLAIVDVSDVKNTLEKWTTLPAIAVPAKIFGVTYSENYNVKEVEITFMEKEFYTNVIKKDNEFLYIELRNEKDGALAYQNLIDKKILVKQET